MTPKTYLAISRMMFEAQQVIGYRMLGVAGLWPVAASENWRMWAEKGPAFLAAAQGAGLAMARGASPDAIISAWVAPIGRKTRGNARRLSRRR